MTLSPAVRLLLRYLALAYVVILVIVPVALILWRTFQPGVGAFFESITTPAARVGAAAVATRRGDRRAAQRPFRRAHRIGVGAQQVPRQERPAGGDRPTVRGVTGRGRCRVDPAVGLGGICSGSSRTTSASRSSSASPASCLASIFVTVPFVIREVEPVLHEIGTDQEEAAATLGSQWWQTFWRVTLPSIRWGLTYGVVLTVARTLGEFGAVIMVSSNLPGTSQTLTLLVADRYNRGDGIRRLRGVHTADDGRGDRPDRSGGPRRPTLACEQAGLRRREK